jgi:hypothetical protein
MMTRASIAELQDAGVRLDAEEAVAIAQRLIEALQHGDAGAGVAPPYGPPAAANVYVNADGSVSCAGCGATPAVSEVAIFLDALLPAGSPRVPGGLRYAIARGLLDVDVRPFDSLDEFAEALSRYEAGPRDVIVRGVLARAGAPCTALARPIPAGVQGHEQLFHSRPRERRHTDVNVTELRRALREADVRLYYHRLALASLPPPRSARTQAMPAVAACLGAGFLLIATGQFMHERELASRASVPMVAPAPIAPAPPLTPLPGPAVDTDRISHIALPPGAPAAASVAPARTQSVDTARVVRRPAGRGGESAGPAKPTARPSAGPVSRGRKRTAHGVLDHRPLRWLRDAFRSDL